MENKKIFLNLNSEKLLQAIKSTGTVFVKFQTEWCGVCKVNAPILQKVINEVQPENMSFYTIDVDQEKLWEDENNHFAIKLVPTYMIFKDGIKIWEQNNFVPEKMFREQLNKHVKK